MTNDMEFDDSETENLEMTLPDIYAKLLLEDDIIIVIAKEDFDDLKAGLTSVKAKENIKLKAMSMPVDTTKLQFTELTCTDCSALEMRLQISLKKRRTISIKSIEKVGGF